MAFIDSVDAHHSHALGVCVPTTLSPPSTSTIGICRATPPPLAAHIGGGGGHSSFGDSTSTTSAVSFTAQELGQLRHLLIASGFSSPDASSSTSSVKPLTMPKIMRLQCLLDASFGSPSTVL